LVAALEISLPGAPLRQAQALRVPSSGLTAGTRAPGVGAALHAPAAGRLTHPDPEQA